VFQRSAYYTDLFFGKIRPKKKVNVHKKDVDVALQNCISWFLSNQNKNGSFGLRRWEVWDTANAVLSLLSAKTPKEDLEHSIDFILSSQREDGGFFYETLPPTRNDLIVENAYCIETTSVALQSLYSYFNKVTSEIKDGINFLLNKQTKSGGWELPYLLFEKNVVTLSGNYYPSVTGYALQALLATDSCTGDVLKTAIDFLESSQRKEGSWGENQYFYDTESYAIKNIINAFSLAKKREMHLSLEPRVDVILEKCLEYSESRQLSNGSWPIKPHKLGKSSKVLSTSLYLQSLLYGKSSNRSGINRGIRWLLSNQKKDGSWKGGIFDGTKIDNFVTEKLNPKGIETFFWKM
jgi:prenyltransferase beta subunit